MKRRHVPTKTLTNGFLLFFLLCVPLIAACCGGQSARMTEQFEYDGEGRLMRYVAPDGRRTAYTYNEHGLPTNIMYPGGWVKYDYNANGNRAWMRDETGTAEYYYDAFGRLIAVVSRHSPWTMLRATYNPWGNISSLSAWNLELLKQQQMYKSILDELQRQSADSVRSWKNREQKIQALISKLENESLNNRRLWLEYEIGYQYDVLGRLIEVNTPSGEIRYLHDPGKGLVERRLPNGIVTTSTYEPDGLLRTLRHENPQGQIIAEYHYEYNPAGKVTVAREIVPGSKPQITKYLWDTRGYLKELQMPDGNTLRYEYDSMGNRVLEQGMDRPVRYEYDDLGRLSGNGALSYEWDRNGNLISKTGKDYRARIQYDGRSLPLFVRASTGLYQYEWDGDSNLISRTKGKETTHYLPNPFAPPGCTLAEFDPGDGRKTFYSYGDVLLGRHDVNGPTEYFLEDGFNSIRYSTTTNGEIQKQWRYTPFGEQRVVKGNVAAVFRTAGERYLPELGSYIIDKRLYDPYTGRYFSPARPPEHLAKPDSLNKYAHGCTVQGMYAEPRCNQTHKNNEERLRAVAAQFRPWTPPSPSATLSRDMLVPLLPGENMPFSFEYHEPQRLPYFFGPPSAIFASQPGSGTIPGSPAQAIAASIPWLLSIINKETQDKYDPFVQATKVMGALQEYANECAGALMRQGKSPRTVVSVYICMGVDGTVTVTRYSNSGYIIASGSRILGADLYVGYDSKEEFRQEKRVPELRAAPARRLPKKEKRDDNKPYKGPDWPDGGGPDDPGGPGGPGDAFGNGFMDPFMSVDSQLGGVRLSAGGDFFGQLGDITSAVFDRGKGYLVLVGDRNLSVPSLAPEDLAVALACVYSAIPKYPSFSLDPADRKNPRGDWLKCVYRPEQILAGTEFGEAMLRADWLLKEYASGVIIRDEASQSDSTVPQRQGEPYILEANYPMVYKRESSVPDLNSVATLSFAENARKEEKEREWARYWIEPEKMHLRELDHHIYRKLDYAIYFDLATMRVKAKRQVPDPSSPTGLRDVDIDDPIASEFATMFTKRYDKIAEESPEFERLRQLAKALAFAKWLKKENIPVDTDWIAGYINKQRQYSAQKHTLSVIWRKQDEKTYRQGNRRVTETSTRDLHLSGGVDLTFALKFLPDDDGKAQKFQEHVIRELREEEIAPAFDMSVDEKPYRAVVLPITPGGGKIWEKWKGSPVKVVNGVRYHFDDMGRLIKSTDGRGNLTEYEVGMDGKLEGVSITLNDGSKFEGTKKRTASVWTTVDSRGNSFDYLYSDSGHLKQVSINGERFADYAFDTITNRATVNYDGFVETATYDRMGQPLEYKQQYEQAGRLVDAGTLQFAWDNQNRPAGIRLNGARLSYDEYPSGSMLSPMSSPRKPRRFKRDKDGRLIEIIYPDDSSIQYVYEGDTIARILRTRGEAAVEYAVVSDNTIQVKDSLGSLTVYDFEDGNLSSVDVDGQGTARYSYDDQARVTEIRLPNGTQVNYDYEEVDLRTRARKQEKNLLVRATMHPAARQVEPLPRDKRVAQREPPKPPSDPALRARLQDDQMASQSLRNSVIVDVFAQGRDSHVNIVDSKGAIHEVSPEASKELRRLLQDTTRTRGRLGEKMQEQWENFFREHLGPAAEPTRWKDHEGREVTLKPTLIIKSNEVDYRYGNLEKVSALADNFTIFIASKFSDAKGITETPASELANKIRNIPRLSRDNAVVAIRLPEMSEQMQAEWQDAVAELSSVIGSENVFFNPTREQFDNMLKNQGKEVVLVELTHTDQGLLLENNEKYVAEDVLRGADLSHIKYLMGGMGTCNLARLERGKLVSALREKGVGVVNTAYGEVSAEIALKRLKQLIPILKNIEHYDIPAYHMLDLIDQILGIVGKNTTNVARLKYNKGNNIKS